MHLLREAIEQAAMQVDEQHEVNLDEDSVSASLSTSSSVSSASANSANSALSLVEDTSSSLSTSSENLSNSVPLVLRLFELLAGQSRHSDTWRYLLRAAAPDLVDYLSRQSDAASSILEDPFYPELEHEIRVVRRLDAADRQGGAKNLQWRIGDAATIGRRTILTVDSDESTITMTRCSQLPEPVQHGGCCSLRCWPVDSLQDYARCLDAVYLNSCRLLADRIDLMRGRYHSCRRG
ncbi:hypothetical protein BOX15_Mlig030252g1 [Macrostomum lignano]|uniref:Uncharacterized protein n=1 Tax=Macrostomum lignano TaxID=282301 RepID=A0A267HAD7_9PLAT|nr:hypothetical protein BOX15_Mlig030252g1 [Macrostomum lignano]